MMFDCLSQDCSKATKVLVPGLNLGFDRPTSGCSAGVVGSSSAGHAVRNAARLHESHHRGLDSGPGGGQDPPSSGRARLQNSALGIERMTPPVSARQGVVSETPPARFPGASATSVSASTASGEGEGFKGGGGVPHFPGDPVHTAPAPNRRGGPAG